MVARAGEHAAVLQWYWLKFMPLAISACWVRRYFFRHLVVAADSYTGGYRFWSQVRNRTLGRLTRLPGGPSPSALASCARIAGPIKLMPAAIAPPAAPACSTLRRDQGRSIGFSASPASRGSGLSSD